MKKIFYFAVAALALSACTSDELVGVIETPEQEVEEVLAPIAFGSKTSGMTRADHVGATAAGMLGNNFVVEGIKGNGDYTGSLEQIEDFDHYNVNYVAGTANTTESNTQNWEYVNQTKHELSAASQQTIKYWDYSVAQYDFIAFSYGTSDATNLTLSAIDYTKLGNDGVNHTTDPTPGADETAPVYTVAGTATELAKAYVADLTTIYKKDFAKAAVTPKFRSLGAKVRIAFYETVPGYSVKDVKFYTDKTRTTPSQTADATPVPVPTIFAEKAVIPSGNGTMKIYYPTVGAANVSATDYNKAHISFAATAAADKTENLNFGALVYTATKESAEYDNGTYLGRTSATATFAGDVTATNKAYEVVLPAGSSEPLKIHVDYTLVPIDGSQSVITVRSASAIVPAKYTDWQPNYAYTYIFKISMNSNGTTGNPGGTFDPNKDTDGDGIPDIDDPDDDNDGTPDEQDPDPDGDGDPTNNIDPVGLFPITFDATVMDDMADGIQETITTVATPSLTTYAKGVNPTAAGTEEYAINSNIYVSIENNTVWPALSAANTKLYTVTLEGPASAYVSVTGDAVVDGKPYFTSNTGNGKFIAHLNYTNVSTTNYYNADGTTITGDALVYGTTYYTAWDGSTATGPFTAGNYDPSVSATYYEYVPGAAQTINESSVANCLANYKAVTAAAADVTSHTVAIGDLTAGADVSAYYTQNSDGDYVKCASTATAVAGTTYYAITIISGYVVKDANGKKMVVTNATGLSIATEIAATDATNGNAVPGNYAKFTPAAAGTYVFEYTQAGSSPVYTAVADGTTLTAGNTYYTSSTGASAFVATGSEVEGTTGSYFERTSAGADAIKAYKIIVVK